MSRVVPDAGPHTADRCIWGQRDSLSRLSTIIRLLWRSRPDTSNSAPFTASRSNARLDFVRGQCVTMIGLSSQSSRLTISC